MATTTEPEFEAYPPMIPAEATRNPHKSSQDEPEKPGTSPTQSEADAKDSGAEQSTQTPPPGDKATSSSPASSVESGEASESEEGEARDAGKAPQKEDVTAPPLPDEPVPQPQQEEDDGWEYHWNPNTNSYWFYNRHTQVWQQENPRLAPAAAVPDAPGGAAAPPLPSGGPPGTSAVGSVANGYNPAIHGDYDPNAWYAQEARAAEAAAEAAAREYQQQQALALAGGATADMEGGDAEYGAGGFFNRATGQWQRPDQSAERHGDDARSRRQMNAYFDVDAAANMHDGRSLRAERAGKKPSKAELKAFKEKRKAKKEERRRAWLRD